MCARRQTRHPHSAGDVQGACGGGSVDAQVGGGRHQARDAAGVGQGVIDCSLMSVVEQLGLIRACTVSFSCPQEGPQRPGHSLWTTMHLEAQHPSNRVKLRGRSEQPKRPVKNVHQPGRSAATKASSLDPSVHLGARHPSSSSTRPGADRSTDQTPCQECPPTWHSPPTLVMGVAKWWQD